MSTVIFYHMDLSCLITHQQLFPCLVIVQSTNLIFQCRRTIGYQQLTTDDLINNLQLFQATSRCRFKNDTLIGNAHGIHSIGKVPRVRWVVMEILNFISSTVIITKSTTIHRNPYNTFTLRNNATIAIIIWRFYYLREELFNMGFRIYLRNAHSRVCKPDKTMAVNKEFSNPITSTTIHMRLLSIRKRKDFTTLCPNVYIIAIGIETGHIFIQEQALALYCQVTGIHTMNTHIGTEPYIILIALCN